MLNTYIVKMLTNSTMSHIYQSSLTFINKTDHYGSE